LILVAVSDIFVQRELRLKSISMKIIFFEYVAMFQGSIIYSRKKNLATREVPNKFLYTCCLAVIFGELDFSSCLNPNLAFQAIKHKESYYSLFLKIDFLTKTNQISNSME